MDRSVTQLVVQDRKIAYFLTDQNLYVAATGGRADMLAKDPSTWLGQSLVDLLPELVGSESVLGDILAGRLPRFELAWVNRETAEKEPLYWRMLALPHHGPADDIVGLLFIVEDETEAGILQQALAQHQNELRLLQDQLARKNLELQASNQELLRLDGLKSEFVSVAAHELRTPLTSIAGYMEMLLDGQFGSVSDEQRESLQIIQRSVNRLAALTGELLDVVRIESGRVELVLQPTDLAALAKMVSEELQPQFQHKSQQLALQASSELPKALCDPVRAGQVIRNLLSNASRYTPSKGQIWISVGPAEEAGYLQVSVADNGIGIAMKDQPNLFSRFFRAESAYESGESGAGLGLYITRALVEQHGGRIWFESEPNKGSTFHVTFPMAD